MFWSGLCLRQKAEAGKAGNVATGAYFWYPIGAAEDRLFLCPGAWKSRRAEEQSHESLQILFGTKERRQTKQDISHHSFNFGYLRLQVARDFRARRQGAIGAEKQNMVCLILVFERRAGQKKQNIKFNPLILNVSRPQNNRCIPCLYCWRAERKTQNILGFFDDVRQHRRELSSISILSFGRFNVAEHTIILCLDKGRKSRRAEYHMLSNVFEIPEQKQNISANCSILSLLRIQR